MHPVITQAHPIPKFNSRFFCLFNPWEQRQARRRNVYSILRISESRHWRSDIQTSQLHTPASLAQHQFVFYSQFHFEYSLKILHLFLSPSLVPQKKENRPPLRVIPKAYARSYIQYCRYALRTVILSAKSHRTKVRTHNGLSHKLALAIKMVCMGLAGCLDVLHVSCSSKKIRFLLQRPRVRICVSLFSFSGRFFGLYMLKNISPFRKNSFRIGKNFVSYNPHMTYLRSKYFNLTIITHILLNWILGF